MEGWGKGRQGRQRRKGRNDLPRNGGSHANGNFACKTLHVFYKEYVPGVVREKDWTDEFKSKFVKDSINPSPLCPWQQETIEAVNNSRTYPVSNRVFHLISQPPQGTQD